MALRAPSMMRVHRAICVTVNLPGFPPELVAAIVVLIAEEHAYTPDNWPAFVAFVDEVIECFGIHDPTKSVDEKEHLSIDTNVVYRKAFVAISSHHPPRARFARRARWTIEPAVPGVDDDEPPAEGGAAAEAVVDQVGDEHEDDGAESARETVPGAAAPPAGDGAAAEAVVDQVGDEHEDDGVESAQETVAYIRRPFAKELKMPGAPPSIEAKLRELFNDEDWSPFIEELDELYDRYKVSMTVVAREWPSRNPSDSDWLWFVRSQSPSTTSLDSVTGSSDFSQRDVSDDAVSSGPPSTSSSENNEAQPVRVRRSYSMNLELPDTAPIRAATVRAMFTQAYTTLEGDWPWFIQYLDRTFQSYKIIATVVGRDKSVSPPRDLAIGEPVDAPPPRDLAVDEPVDAPPPGDLAVDEPIDAPPPRDLVFDEAVDVLPTRDHVVYRRFFAPANAEVSDNSTGARRGELRYRGDTAPLITLVLGALDDSAHIHSRTFAKMSSATVPVRAHSLDREFPAASIVPVNASTSDGGVFSDVFNFLASKDFFEHMEGVLDYLGVFQLLGLPPVDSDRTPPQAHHEHDAAPIEPRHRGGRGMPSRVPQHFEPNERVARFAAGVFPHDFETQLEFQDIVHEAVASLEIGSGLSAFRKIFTEFDSHHYNAAATLDALYEKYPRRA